MSDKHNIENLREIIRSCPVIDNHGHNILRPSLLQTHDLLSISTEAAGEALTQTTTSLPHFRAAKQLRLLYGLTEDADWETITQRRLELLGNDADRLFAKCFAGTATVLIDDGLGSPEEIERYDWHSKYTTLPCKRIVRVEAVAADLLASLYQQGRLPIGVEIADEEACSLAWLNFITAFESNIAKCLADPEVAGFKSVICYRSGLDITLGTDLEVTEEGLRSFRKHFLPICKVRGFRVAHKGMNDALVISTCKLLTAAYRQANKTKPLQFHTGLGDSDISLIESNPAYMQKLIEAYPSVPIVLLHSSYPYTKEAGYLSTVYKNVYLDIGEVFPMTSRDAQEQIVRQAFDITPTSKILWSTDGHHFPETYYLANLQGRQAIEKVMLEYVEQEDLTMDQAITAVTDIFFNNSNKLYDLGYTMPKGASSEPTIVEPTNVEPVSYFSRNIKEPVKSGNALVRNTDNSYTPIPDAQNMVTLDTNIDLYFVQWIDYLGTLRMRCIPARNFHRLGVADELKFSISKGNLGTLQNDGLTTEAEAVGQLFVHPDLTTLKPLTKRGSLSENAVTVMSSFYTEDGKPHSMCPRRSLSAAVSELKHDFKQTMRIGFEIECTFCRRNHDGSEESYSPLTTNHAWSTFSDEQYTKSFPLMLDIQKGLAELGIHIQQWHSESGPGQYEFVLPPAHPITAIDTLYQARQCIQQIAASRGLRATLYPTPFNGVGNASHIHISLRANNSLDGLEAQQTAFMAGILEHLPAICAFTMPEAVSYERVKSDSWTGGTMVAWGTQNREVPLRRIADLQGKTQRWELRCVDGLPNMYLAMLAVIKAGMTGLKQKMAMKIQDLTRNPARLTKEDLEALGITRPMPVSLDESLKQLSADSTFATAMGEALVKHYSAMKHDEQQMLMAMSERDRRTWLIERY